MDKYAIWTPKFDGDAPPNWKAGMGWGLNKDGSDFTPHFTPFWETGLNHTVPPEAIGTDDAAFDLQAWLSQGRANADKLPSGVAEALGPERDWADELAHKIVSMSENLATSHEEDRQEAAAIIRTRCQPIGNNITDAMQHVAYFDEVAYFDKGEFHWKSGIAPRDCELYTKWKGQS